MCVRGLVAMGLSWSLVIQEEFGSGARIRVEDHIEVDPSTFKHAA